jgi:hypothetical protein
MDYGVRKKVDTRANLLGNKLVLIAAKDARIDPVTIGPDFDLAKLAGDGRLATGDVREVPVGLYAKAARLSSDVRFWRQSGHRWDQAKCPLLTQSGHWADRPLFELSQILQI